MENKKRTEKFNFVGDRIVEIQRAGVKKSATIKMVVSDDLAEKLQKSMLGDLEDDNFPPITKLYITWEEIKQ